MKSLHILHSEAATGWGGQEIRVFQESKYLVENGHRVSLVCQPGSPMEDRCQTFSHPNFQAYPLAMGAALSPTAFWALLSLIKKTRPDILHTHSSIDSWLVSFCGRVLKIPIVRSRHVSIPVKNFFPKNWVYSSFPEKIITSGEAISNMMTKLNGVSRDKVVSISAGADMRRFDFAVSGQAVREEMQLAPDQPLIGKIGVVRGWKGHDYFLKCVPLVLEKVPQARFFIAGAGPGFEEISRKAGEQGLNPYLKMLGHREDIPELLAACDVMVLASTAGEGTPQVIPQAFAMKTPVVATRVASVPDLLGNGDRGVLVEKESGPSLAGGIVELLRDRDKGKRMADRAYDFCKQELTFDKMMDRTLAVYQEVLSRSPGK